MKARIGVDPGSDDKTSFVIVRQTAGSVTFTPAEIEPHPNPAIEAAIKSVLESMQPEFDAYAEAIMKHGAVRLVFEDGKLVAKPIERRQMFLP